MFLCLIFPQIPYNSENKLRGLYMAGLILGGKINFIENGIAAQSESSSPGFRVVQLYPGGLYTETFFAF